MTRRQLVWLFRIHIFVIIVFWFVGSGPLLILGLPSVLLAIGRLFGLLAVGYTLVQFALIGRQTFIESVVGLDKLSQIHKRHGKLLIYFIILHPIFIIFSYSLFGRISFLSQLGLFLQTPYVVFGLIAAVLFCVVVFTSIYIVFKHLNYEAWYFVHFLTYVAVLFSFLHQLEVVAGIFYYYWLGLYIFFIGSFVLYRWIRPLILFAKHGFYIEKIVPETDDATSIYIQGKDLQSLPRKAGQFAKYIFLDKKRFWQAHPFSLSVTGDKPYIRITVKNSGDFTSEIKNLKPGTKVFVDGYYGIFTKKVSKKNKVLFIAGGIGITPIRSLIEEMTNMGKDTVLLYSNKTSKEIVFKDELGALKAKIIHVITEEPGFKGEKDRIDLEKIKRLVPDYEEREVYLCGPVPFMDAIKEIMLELGIKEDLIHFEKFSLH